MTLRIEEWTEWKKLLQGIAELSDEIAVLRDCVQQRDAEIAELHKSAMGGYEDGWHALRNERDALRYLCAAVYQAAGAYEMPVRFLDALSDAANGVVGERQKTDSLLPCLVPPALDELAKLKAGIAEAPVVTVRRQIDGDGDTGKLPSRDDLPANYIGKRVRLLVEDEG